MERWRKVGMGLGEGGSRVMGGSAGKQKMIPKYRDETRLKRRIGIRV